MNSLTDVYITGSKAYNHFFDMLHLAMLESMDKIIISGSGAWVWRGYRIDAYKDLAEGLFYCQIDQDYPNNLIFKESYYFPNYKPIDPRDIQYFIKTGGYYHPFRMTLDLYQSRFFLFSKSEQYEILRNFVSYASSQALVWQHSAARGRPEITDKEFLQGNRKIQPNSLTRPSGYEQVSIDYLSAIPLQDEILMKLETIVKEALRGNYKWLFRNANWRNWDFRGWRLNVLSGDSADYTWEIHYSEPEKIVCYNFENGARKREGYFDIHSTEYFDQDSSRQDVLLRDFVNNSLRGILP